MPSASRHIKPTDRPSIELIEEQHLCGTLVKAHNDLQKPVGLRLPNLRNEAQVTRLSKARRESGADPAISVHDSLPFGRTPVNVSSPQSGLGIGATLMDELWRTTRTL